MEVKRLQFDTVVSGYEKVNPEFAKVKVHIMYEGLNRNGSFFNKDIINKMLPSIKNVPVIGEYLEDSDSFGGHGGKLEISDKGMKFIPTTVPFGVVPSDTELTWERLREKDGMTEHEYLTCFAYLWVGRYPELETVLNDGANQSMEIGITDYHFDDKGVMMIDDAYFSALCILGKDVEPCFEQADIQPFALNKEQFKLEFSQMIEELKASLNEKEGKEVEDTMEDEKVVEEVVEETPAIEEFSANASEETVEEVAEETTEEAVIETAEPATFAQEEVHEEVIVEESKEDIVELQSKQIFELNVKYTNLQSDYQVLLTEIKELRDYKANNESAKSLVEKQNVISEYSIGLTAEEMKPVIDKINDMSVTEIKVQLNDIFTKKNLAELKSKKFELEENIEQTLQVDILRKESPKSRYAV